MRANFEFRVARGLALLMLLLAPVVMQAQKGKTPPPATTIALEATIDPAFKGISGDFSGSYRSMGGSSVEINAEGDLLFSFMASSGRSIFLDFTTVLRPPSDVGFVPPGSDDSVCDWMFRTMYISGAPRQNLRLMVHGQVAAVRLHFHITPPTGDNFWLKGDPTNPLNSEKDHTGLVQVTAWNPDCEASPTCDRTPNGVKRWIFESLPGTESRFQLLRFVKGPKGTSVRQDFGDFSLPFRIVFNRIG